ncbi:MAG: heterocyst frequency control protein PatD [Rhizonema sp. PD37]|nr:heterocyst frequency control protein PatD [Rhizonema sp. PD37]
MSLNKQKYHSFAILLKQLRSDLTPIPLNALELRQRTASLQQFFQQQIVPLDDEGADSQDWGREQSYRTEMSKQLRLLEIDVMFFQGSRQASTAQERLDTINHRLTTLIEYSKAILQTEE